MNTTPLTANQEAAIEALDTETLTSPAELAEKLDTTPEGASRTASSLVTRGLVERVEIAGDRVAYKLRPADSADGTPSVETPLGPTPGGDSTEPLEEVAAENRAAVVRTADEEAAVTKSLQLLRHLGGKAYCGKEDSQPRSMIAMSSASALEADGLVRLEERPSYMVAVLIDAEVAS